MNYRKTSTILIIFVIFVAISNHPDVEATRVLSEDFASTNHLDTYSAVYEKAKRTVGLWLERLPSGPSPPGAGN
ncbi:hypothetical protein CJ030_MR0G008676 [Morella rubra]|uniref:Uncharacterized protein n=1 Tax=Morella rubra TaxID=262757 RepID=A0A6A1UIC5_9ROSI|nr:hypothetical protein CJ030_MR0G008676 [Morella rubra]